MSALFVLLPRRARAAPHDSRTTSVVAMTFVLRARSFALRQVPTTSSCRRAAPELRDRRR